MQVAEQEIQNGQQDKCFRISLTSNLAKHFSLFLKRGLQNNRLRKGMSTGMSAQKERCQVKINKRVGIEFLPCNQCPKVYIVGYLSDAPA